jgi:hypothetical protein
MTLFSTQVSIFLVFSDAKFTDKTGIKAFIDLCLAGALRNSKQSLEELWDTDGDNIKKCHVVLNTNESRQVSNQIHY